MDLINYFSSVDWLTMSVSALLFIAAVPICRSLNSDNISTRVSMMRTLNVLIIIAIIVRALLWQDNHQINKMTQSLIVIYFAFVCAQFINFFVRKRFGKQRKSNNQIILSDTYSSRGLSIIVTVLVTIIALISCLKILGFDSLLETGGILGIIGIFLAMTQGSWAPDIINGLIILNSRLCEEGDVVQFNMDGTTIIASIFRTKLFHTECLDLANNHRIMVSNSKLRDYGVHNLSRFASAKGLRERLLFNIDYKHSENEVRAMLLSAIEKFDKNEAYRETQYEPEVRLFETGDFAVTWAVYYYIKDVKKLLPIRQLLRAYILTEATRSNISLATPVLEQSLVNIEHGQTK